MHLIVPDQQLGTRLESEAFRLLVDLNNPPPTQDQAPAFDVSSKEESNDKSFSLWDSDNGDDDSLGSVTLESAFASINIRSEISDAKTLGKRRRRQRKRKRKRCPTRTVDDGMHVTTTVDSRYHAVYHLRSGWEGIIFVNDKGNALMAEVYVPHPIRDAATLTDSLGIQGDNDVHMVGMKTLIKKKKLAHKKQGGQLTSNNPNMIVVVAKLLDLPRKVRPVVLNPMGQVSDEVTIECYPNGVEVAHIFLQIVDDTTPNPRPRVHRNNRDRTRNREGMDG